MKQLNRRSFIKGSLATAAALSMPARSWAQAAGANSDIRVAVVGFKGRGQNHISDLKKLPGVRLVALCDADSAVLGAAAKKLADQGQPVKTAVDVRQLLEDKEIDVISTATPNHWHSLITVWACQAGKDVYVEKPISHNVWEGRQAVLAARKYDRIVQTGTQCRSSVGLIESIQWLQSGQLGKIRVARGLCYKRRNSIGKVSGPQPIPEGIDYDLWCGPAPKDPLTRKNLHYDWHWVWPTGNGDLGNQGIHQMDIARWVLGENALSPRVFSVGGRLGYVDDGTTPNTQFVFHDYAAAPLIFEVRGLPTPAYRGSSVGVVIDCEGGSMVIPSYTKAIALDKNGDTIKEWNGGGDHFANFIKAVRSRKSSDLTADILEGHLSSALCHTGNISYLTGSTADPGTVREKIQSDPESLETFERMAEHLAEAGVDLTKEKLTLGSSLKMDPKSERFLNSDEANKLLTRNYRASFIVPKNV